MRIYDVKRIHEDKHPSSNFFDRATMRFFNQRLRDYSVRHVGNGAYRVACPMRDYRGNYMGETVRIFNSETGELAMEKEE